MLKWYSFLAKGILETEVGTQKWAMTSVMGSCNTIVRMYVFNKTFWSLSLKVIGY